MRLLQINIPARDIELIRYWYMRYFAMKSSELHTDEDGVKSYRLNCPDDSCFILVTKNDEPRTALTLAISVGSRQGVDFVTELLRTDGHRIDSEPKNDVYGVYHSVALDPEGNRVMVTE